MIYGRQILKNERVNVYMGKRSLRNKVFSGVFWRFGEQISSQLVAFIVSIVLARLLTPRQYGLVAIVTVFITIANVFITESFSKALIQKKDSNSEDFSSVFFFNIFFSWIVYFIVFFTAPLIAKFYNAAILIPVTRTLALIIPIAGINSIQQSYVSKTMQFQRFFWSTLIGTIVSGIVGITMAYKGFGIWSLVSQQIVNNLMNTLVLWFTVRWRPTLEFNLQELKVLISFGWKVLLTNLINTFYDNIKSLIMGKIYSSEALAFYNRGVNYPSLIVSNVTISLDSVLFPALSEIQDDRGKIKRAIRKSISVTTYIIFPLMAGLAGVAHNLIGWMLTDKWLPAVPYMQIECLVFALYPINITNLQAILAVGKSNTYLRLNIIKKGIGFLCVFLAIPFGPFVMAATDILVGFLAIFTNVFANKALFNYSIKELNSDCFKNAMMSLIMFILVLSVGNLTIFINSQVFVLIIQLLIGVVSYLLLSIIFKSSEYYYLLNILKEMI